MPVLPPDFVRNMTRLLGGETDRFLRSYDEPRSYGLRLNRLKLDERHSLIPALTGLFGLRPVPWCPDGYFYEASARPGRHIYHAAGLYYIQEPSAMIAAELLDPVPGETVLDLAAAPGGKTTQLAAKLRGEGLLVANEIHPARAKILSENVERLGIPNAIVTQAAPQELSARYPETFDRVLLDAPCSGEGMFRKDPEAIAEWSEEAVETCAQRQRDILPHAAAMLKPGGTLVYSTCTFNTLENEETVADFLQRFPEFRLLREERMWPHLGQGEGHYAALLRKDDVSQEQGRRPAGMPARREGGKPRKGKGAEPPEASALSSYVAFAQESLPGFRLPPHGQPLVFGDALFWLPVPPGSAVTPASLRGLKVPRPGLHLGDIRSGGRFEPNHSLAMAIPAEAARFAADFPAGSAEAAAYWHGESLPAPPGAKGWGLAAVDGFPLGWVKASDGQCKNRLPKGLRSP
ncbi:RNA methyltransferase [Cohnella sp. CFH 77786]|uniref:RsmB/NOP family class I SAM-dependent RNA methyltransferase n=1 Tax=Cohnella sp. CFH 77786 TaxID=2662265 RepID=UPI001C6097B7|nr:RsmB/NOP family class I SAM-dependent RNA methyltransferase [Cohnella sp. CFH 77786]MBW5445116.1 RNA methyltransferase [Cohnella sp. CFH 77786]